MERKAYDYGMIGLGTMGRSLVYNICDHGYSVAGFDKDLSKVGALDDEKGAYNILGARNMKDFLNALAKPRVILLLVPAGPIVDAVIDEMRPMLSGKDIVMDCGNSHFTDTDRRMADLAKSDIYFLGVGVSGGEAGARYGPSIMPGGSKEAYAKVSGMLDDVAAKVNGEPCVTYIGAGSSGHYVKMVHNGIEYALMQLISESYHLLKESAGLGNQELHDIYSKWNEGRLQSYLVSITAGIFSQKDDLTPNDLVDMILDTAHQKGTGKWMSQNAMDLYIPVPAIDAAVSARDLSALKTERVSASKKLKGTSSGMIVDKKDLIEVLEQALFFSMITTYSQGISLLYHASQVYKYELRLDDVAKIWRGGCIIRAALLENIRSAFHNDPVLQNLMLNPDMAEKLAASQAGMRRMIEIAVSNGIPIPAMSASLAYYDTYRSEWLPTNLVQAQRDLFGAHTYQRTDREGNFHTQWNQNK